MKSITLTDEQWDALQAGGEVTIRAPKPKVEKWEPKGGRFYIYISGNIAEGTSTPECRRFGVERTTPKQAERDLPEMYLHNRLLAWRAEHDDVNEPGTHFVGIDERGAYSMPATSVRKGLALGSVLMTRRAAEALALAIHTGEFDL